MTVEVGVIMGSKSDWETMRQACEALTKLDVQFKKRIVSAHRKPQLMTKYANQAAKKSLRVIIAGAGGAAHLPGMIAAQTLVPVIGVPVKSSSLSGLDSLLSIVQMPRGVPVATVAIGEAGAFNAGLLAVQMLAIYNQGLCARLEDLRNQTRATVLATKLP